MSGIYTFSILSPLSVSLSLFFCRRVFSTRSWLSSDGGCQGGVMPYPEESSVSTDLVSLCPSTRSTGESGKRSKRKARALFLEYCVTSLLVCNLKYNILLCSSKFPHTFFLLWLKHCNKSVSLFRDVYKGADLSTPPRQASAPSCPVRLSQKVPRSTTTTPAARLGVQRDSTPQ